MDGDIEATGGIDGILVGHMISYGILMGYVMCDILMGILKETKGYIYGDNHRGIMRCINQTT